MIIAACQVLDLRDDVQSAVRIIKEMASEAKSHGANIVLFPECFLQGYFSTPRTAARLAMDLKSPEFEAVLEQLKTVEPMLIVGLIERADHHIFNSAVVIKHGKLVGRYRKTCLLDGEKAAFRPGNEYPVFQIAGKTFGINICYDLNFSESVSRLTTQGAEVIVCPCNNMMSVESSEKYKHTHNQIRSERAIESSVWLVSADVTGSWDSRVCYGPTAVINPNGQIVDQLPLGSTGMLTVDI